MITMIRTVWKLLQVVLGCIITMLLLSWGIPRYLEWRETNSVPVAVVRVEDALYRAVDWVREKLEGAPSAGEAVDFVYSRACKLNAESSEDPHQTTGNGASSQDRYERNLKAITALQRKLSKE